ncbi:MAG: hypothetical protein INF50_14580 [Rhodobacter sp.]|nr:hypothetical protein [Rhodobacter sp.]
MLRIKAIPHPRFFLFLALLFCGIAGASGFMKPEEAVVAGFNIAALGFIAASIPLFLRDQPDDLRRRGARDDGGRVFLLLSSAIVLALIRGSIRNLVFQRTRSRRHNHDPGLRRVLNDGAEPIEPGLPPIGLRARHRSHAFIRAEGAASRPSLRAGKAGGCCAAAPVPGGCCATF